MFWVFSSGVRTGWASICGALVPPLALIGAMPVDNQIKGKLCDELMAWYMKFPFPEYQPAGMDLPKVPVDSSLCHVSVTKWMKEAGVARGSEERKHRCGGLTADCVIKTVDMLNKLADTGAFEKEHQPHESVETCMRCHDNMQPYTHGKENCNACHAMEPVSVDECEQHVDWLR